MMDFTHGIISRLDLGTQVHVRILPRVTHVLSCYFLPPEISTSYFSAYNFFLSEQSVEGKDSSVVVRGLTKPSAGSVPEPVKAFLMNHYELCNV